jgi:3-phenylpropionate/trans-cinnamate dioxygenase ferredoxin reductase component
MPEAKPRRIVVIGGGPAGVFASIEAKRKDPAAEVILLTEEHCEPYEKPPLSKAVLTGKSKPEDALIAGRGGTAAHKIVLECHACCTAIDRTAREVVTGSGRRYPYDALVLATGCENRELPQLPIGTPRVHYLRTEADARALKASLQLGKHLLLIGGGLIGLEVAASATHIGVKTTVLEVADRILARVCDKETGDFIEAHHRKHGVEIHTGTGIEQVQATDTGMIVKTKDGRELKVDAVVVGIGVKPNVKLAAEAGLKIDAKSGGIEVDQHCRTADSAIYAAGDAVLFPGRNEKLVRLENWRHAQDHGAVAGRNAAGANEVYATLPSFWSEQYDLYIQGVGWPSMQPGTLIHRPVGDGRQLVFEVADGVLVSAMGINVQRDLAAARRLIERKIPVDAKALADPSRPLAEMLKATA